jgi:ribosomal protein S27AE
MDWKMPERPRKTKPCPICGRPFFIEGGRKLCPPCGHNRDDFRARIKTNVDRALRLGLLVRQPCEVCGREKVDAHHDDYSQPLKVRWLCRRCHGQHHARLNREQSSTVSATD